jgi:hypothetical protein
MAGVERHFFARSYIHFGAVLSQRPPLGCKGCSKHVPASALFIVTDALKQSGTRPHRPLLFISTNDASGKASSAVARLQ